MELSKLIIYLTNMCRSEQGTMVEAQIGSSSEDSLKFYPCMRMGPK